MATVTTTKGKAVLRPSLDSITIYAPDGTPHVCAPVDAREILASGNGYTAEPPAAKVKRDEQPREQQSIHGDADGGQEDAEGQAGQTAQEKGSQGAKVAARGRKSLK